MNLPSRAAAAGALLTVLLLAAPARAAQRGDSVVIEAGRIVTLEGPDIERGVIVVEDGTIVAVGEADAVERPWDAPAIGGFDLVAFPGFVEAHTSRGMDRPNESIDVAPYLDVRDSIDPVDFYFEDCLRWGITTVNVQQGNDCVIGARGMVVRPHGMTIAEMVVRPAFGLKLSMDPKRGESRATQAAALREAFAELRAHLEELVREKRDAGAHAEREALFQGRELEEAEAKGRPMEGTAWKVEGLELVPRGKVDEKLRPLLELVEGRVNAFVYCGEPQDVGRALDLARENGFLARAALVIDDDCWKAADLIAEAGVPVVLDGDLLSIERDPVTGEETETFVPGVLHEKGVRFALSSQSSTTRSLSFQAARAIGLGLERQVALDAVTRTPAEILGLADRFGRIAEGRAANVVLFDGDPLSVTTFVDSVVIEGRTVYDRATDTRVRHLIEGEEPGPAVDSAAEEEGAGEGGEDEDDLEEVDEEEDEA